MLLNQFTAKYLKKNNSIYLMCMKCDRCVCCVCNVLDHFWEFEFCFCHVSIECLLKCNQTIQMKIAVNHEFAQCHFMLHTSFFRCVYYVSFSNESKRWTTNEMKSKQICWSIIEKWLNNALKNKYKNNQNPMAFCSHKNRNLELQTSTRATHRTETKKKHTFNRNTVNI